MYKNESSSDLIENFLNMDKEQKDAIFSSLLFIVFLVFVLSVLLVRSCEVLIFGDQSIKDTTYQFVIKDKKDTDGVNILFKEEYKAIYDLDGKIVALPNTVSGKYSLFNKEVSNFTFYVDYHNFDRAKLEKIFSDGEISIENYVYKIKSLLDQSASEVMLEQKFTYQTLDNIRWNKDDKSENKFEFHVKEKFLELSKEFGIRSVEIRAW